jgi:gamma-glutamylcyclotransferase (GGCT)/AIG2-like uncharacterized protein YtfP
MDQALLRQLTGKAFPVSAAILRGFRKWSSAGGFPYILPEPGAAVEGLVVRGVDHESLSRLDRYEDEGRLYLRQKVTVTCGERRVACQTYVGNVRPHRPER